ncbi:MAG TPA: N-acetylglucosamine-6-phosphate deacetylase [Thermoanaerobaculia bacterium]|jgi:N-acetylglucosamine-6-phosphate deacetylase|nr:N-acetylglucosamine-6-phosphate deacetylase [Thermoanaerobaculia bacterium]
MNIRQLFGRAFVRGAIQDETLITIGDEAIIDVSQTTDVPRTAERTDCLIAPGFIDVHVHGGDGADFMDADAEQNERILRFHAKHGTTALCATTLSGSVSDIQKAVKAITRTQWGAEVVGIHLEGPFINRQRAGAQDASSIRPADIHELSALLALAPRMRWMMTVAPELDGARALIEHFRNRVLFSIGHTAADYSEAAAALEWGARHFTHLFNAMTGMHHREPGVVGAAFVSDATAELIADGIHVHPVMLRIAATAMPHRIALVTDAMRACGLADGEYKLYGYDVRVAEGAARLPDGTLAGSVLTMGDAVKNMVELADVPIEMVLPLASEVPARVIGVSDRKGRIARNEDADFVLLTTKLEIDRVIVRGADA